MTATPRPWHYIKSSVSIFSNETDDVERIKICDTSTHNKSVQEAQANAVLIVKAVNTHERAKAAIKELLEVMELYPTDLPAHEYETIKAYAMEKAEILLTDMEG